MGKVRFAGGPGPNTIFWLHCAQTAYLTWLCKKVFVILCHFCPFTTPLMILTMKILKKMKKMPGYIILLYRNVYHEWRSDDIWFLKYKVWQTEIFDILGQFLPFQPLDNMENQNFNIEKKNTWRYYHFTHLHHKWQSYDVWFLRYGEWQK